MVNAARQAGIPIDHVVAELAAFPLAAECAFELGLTCLDPMLSSQTPASRASRHLWRQAENEFLGGFPAFSVEEAVAIRDAVWFASGATDPVPLHAYLRGLARQCLEPRGAKAVPVGPWRDRWSRPVGSVETALARQSWRWLGLALPPDLLLAALGTNHGGPDDIELLSPSLRQHLDDHGYAETHLHLGAAIEFPDLWVSALRAVADPTLKEDGFHSPGAALGEGRWLASWLIRAALVRYLLAAFLSWGRSHGDFTGFICTEVRERIARQLGPTAFAFLFHGLLELRLGRLSGPTCSFAFWQGLYAEMTGVTGKVRRLDRLDQLATADSIESLLPQPGRGRWSAEMRFISASLSYIEASSSAPAHQDHLFAELFWQTIRVRVLFYRHVVQRPMTPGLQWFIRFYGRSSPARGPLTTPVYLESAALLSGVGEGLCSLEVRRSPYSRTSDLVKFVTDVEHVAAGLRRTCGPSRPSLEIGVVFHFAKERGGGAHEGAPTAHWQGTHADPVCAPHLQHSRNPAGYRYADFYRDRRAEAIALAWILRYYPLTLELVRGLDVCTDELGIPIWVLVPLMQHVREAAYAASGAVRHRCGLSVPPLRTTVHAGEDFVHLLSGLRFVDEALEGFQLCSGDRLGHGIALGVDPIDWARRAGRIAMVREDRLADLVWEWSWYGRGGSCADRERGAFIEQEIAALSEHILGHPATPYELEVLWRDLYDPERLREVRFPNGPPLTGVDACSRLGRLSSYLTNARIFQRGRELLWIEPSSEGEVLANLQAQLRQKVGASGLTIEVNPTSNLLIGNLGELTAHPLWRLRPPRSVGEALPLSICIGSDDPLVFGSDLRQEYQALCDAMALAGIPDEEARQWLDRTRAAGMESRFTLRRSGRPVLSEINLLEPAVRLPP